MSRREPQDGTGFVHRVQGCPPDVLQGRFSVLGVDAGDELVPRHELQSRLMAEVASHDLGVAAQRERLHAHAVKALPGGRIGLLQARLMQSRHVLGVHMVDGLAATVGQQAGAVRAERVDHGRVEGRPDQWASSQGR